MISILPYVLNSMRFMNSNNYCRAADSLYFFCLSELIISTFSVKPIKIKYVFSGMYLTYDLSRRKTYILTSRATKYILLITPSKHSHTHCINLSTWLSKLNTILSSNASTQTKTLWPMECKLSDPLMVLITKILSKEFL